MYETNFTKKDMTEICPVCNKEITSANREQYKFSSESQALPVHDFCLGKFASKPKGYFEERRKILAIEEKPNSGSLLTNSLSKPFLFFK